MCWCAPRGCRAHDTLTARVPLDALLGQHQAPPPPQELRTDYDADGTLSAGQVAYYYWVAPEEAATEPLWFTATAWEGNPLLFVSATTTTPGPGTPQTWSSTGPGDAFVSDTAACHGMIHPMRGSLGIQRALTHCVSGTDRGADDRPVAMHGTVHVPRRRRGRPR